ncbi:MAG: ATP-binding protein [Faecalibacterium sp.]|nr:ATP-binding protein [Faecalibacterium sp.]
MADSRCAVPLLHRRFARRNAACGGGLCPTVLCAAYGHTDGGRTFFLSKDGFSKWIFSALTEFNLFYAFMTIIFFTCERLNISYGWLWVLIRVIPYAVFCTIFHCWGKKSYRKTANEIEQGWWILDLIALGFAVTLNFLVTRKIMLFRATGEEYGIALLVIVTGVFSYIGIFKLLRLVLQKGKYLEETQYLQMHQKLLENALAAQQEKVEIAKQNRYDLRHHNTIVIQLLQNGETRQALEYLGEYQGQLERFHEQEYCKNYGIDALLKVYTEKARQKCIRMTVCAADVPQEVCLSASDLCAAIANALENALEAAEKCKDGWITFRAERYGEYLKIKMENACMTEPAFLDGLPVTTKPGSNGRGTKCICAIAEKTGGMAKFSCENNIFHTKILLKIAKTPTCDET